MKKACLGAVILFVIASSPVFAELSLTDLTNNDLIKEELLPVAKFMSAGLNTGIYTPTSGKIFSLGIQAHLIVAETKGVFQGLPFPGIPLPVYIYAGVRVPLVGVSFYVRGFYLPVMMGMKVSLFGVGAGWDKRLGPVNLRGVASFNRFSLDIDQYEAASGSVTTTLSGSVGFNAASVNAFATLAVIPLFRPYVTFGLSVNQLALAGDFSVTSGASTENVSQTYSLVTANVHVGAGIQLLKVLTIEAYFLPLISGSVSLGFAY